MSACLDPSNPRAPSQAPARARSSRVPSRGRGLGVACAVAWLVAACGGGGAADTGGLANAGSPGGGGIGGTGAPAAVSYGGITQFGSIWVNGIEYDTTSTRILLDDNASASQSQLRLGMVVRVEGSIDDGTPRGAASVVTVEDAVKGYVEQVLDANRLVVMGQTVQIDAATSFENGVRPTTGEAVHVHGLVAGSGAVAAGYIERKTALDSTSPFAVKGLVSNHDSAARTFRLGNLVVNYANATTSDLAAGAWDGRFVTVKGSACAARPVCGTLTATKVEPGGLGTATSSTSTSGTTPHIELEGFVTAVTASGFTLGGQAVSVSSSTRYEGGLLADILVGTKLEVEGTLSNGVLQASQVSLRDGVRLEGNIATLNVAAGTLTLAGVPGVTVSANSLTAYDKVGGLSGLAVGNHLRLRGRATAGNGMQATQLELRSADSRVILQGPISSISGSRVVLMGVTADLAGLGSYADLNGATLTQSSFLARLKAGSIVKVRGTLSGSSPAWSEAELEAD